MALLVTCDISTGIESNPLMLEPPSHLSTKAVEDLDAAIQKYTRNAFDDAKDEIVVNIYDVTRYANVGPNKHSIEDKLMVVTMDGDDVEIKFVSHPKPNRNYFKIEVIDNSIVFINEYDGWRIMLAAAEYESSYIVAWNDDNIDITNVNVSPMHELNVIDDQYGACRFCGCETEWLIEARFNAVVIKVQICEMCIINDTADHNGDRLLRLGILEEMQQ